MLDKSIPYKEVWMKRPLHLPVSKQSLPSGFSFQFYQIGDEKAWGEIESSVLEFEDQNEAAAYFQRTFAPYPEKLAQQMLFVVAPNGEKIATCTAWQKQIHAQNYPLFHWLAVKPEYQGLGVAKALVAHTLMLFQALMKEEPTVYLHTQTWSHDAISLYEKYDFSLMSHNLDGTVNDDYPTVVQILNKLKI